MNLKALVLAIAVLTVQAGSVYAQTPPACPSAQAGHSLDKVAGSCCPMDACDCSFKTLPSQPMASDPGTRASIEPASHFESLFSAFESPVSFDLVSAPLLKPPIQPHLYDLYSVYRI